MGEQATLKAVPIGARFGSLVVVAAPVVERRGQQYRSTVECRCDCGASVSPGSFDLRSGRAVSCGCYGREQLARRSRSRIRDPRAIIESDSCPEPNTGCWLWLRYLNEAGYGAVQHRGAVVLAHRLSYEAFVGVIPDGLFACHKCDTPACVNPGHLFLGTHDDNMADMIAKGRQAPPRLGEQHWKARLTDADVSAVRLDPTIDLAALAAARGVTRNAVVAARAGRSFGHLSVSPIVVRKIRRVSMSVIESIRTEFASGETTQTALAERFGVSLSHVNRIVSGKTGRVADPADLRRSADKARRISK